MAEEFSFLGAELPTALAIQGPGPEQGREARALGKRETAEAGLHNTQ